VERLKKETLDDLQGSGGGKGAAGARGRGETGHRKKKLYSPVTKEIQKIASGEREFMSLDFFRWREEWKKGVKILS